MPRLHPRRPTPVSTVTLHIGDVRDEGQGNLFDWLEAM